ncbi:SSD domain-containing protein [Aphelenchoides besseyi]|nr:SSD domain-containing protein [Aphelenchoides besseyi]
MEMRSIGKHSCGILVYGCQNSLIFVDVNTLKVFQTLTKHYAPITQIRWQPNRSFDDIETDLRCASADSAGHIYVWNVLSGKVHSKFFSQNHAVLDMKWLDWEDVQRDFLLVLHTKTLLALWNANTAEQVWECRLGFNAFSFSLDPFKSGHVVFSSMGGTVVFLSDIKLHRPPSQSPTSLALRNPETTTDTSLFVQLVYHRAYPDLAFAVFKDEILMINTALRQVIYNSHETMGISGLLPCMNRDAFYLIRSNGAVSLHVATTRVVDKETEELEIAYEQAATIEAHRSSGKARVLSAALCPIYDTHMALVYINGKVVFNAIQPEEDRSFSAYRLDSISDHIELRDDLRQIHSKLRLRQCGQIYSLSGAITTLRMRPMVPTEQTSVDFDSVHLAALATSAGVIHLVDVLTCTVIRSFLTHSTSIKSMEWAGGNILISASTSTSLSSSTTVRNDIFATDIRTGQKKRFRPEAEESAIELIRVSYFHRYVAFAFRHEPLEIWDVNSMRLLRRMSKRCPIIVDMAWFGKNPKNSSEDGNVLRENLVVLDVDNHLYHVVVKGLHVRDGKEVNTEWKSSTTSLSCLAWKDDMLVFGDSAGRIRIWNLLKKQSRQTESSQAATGKIVRICFTHLSGDKTLLVQYPSSLLVYDVDNLQLNQAIHIPGLSIVTSDICGLIPIYVSSDNFLRYSTPNNNLCLPVEENAIPTILRSSYRQAAIKLALDGTPISDELKDEDSAYSLLASKLNFSTQLIDRLHCVHQFLGLQKASELFEVIKGITQGKQMPCHLWMFWPREAFKKRIELGTRILMKRCQNLQHVELVIEKAIVLGKKDWATYLLLNYDQGITPNESRFNALKACLLSSDLGKEESQCLVKMTATNLIASNFISDGVQLLYLIDQGLDACKYLAAQNDWARSYSYGKLQPDEAAREIVKKFIGYVCSENVSHKTLVIFLYASLSEWDNRLPSHQKPSHSCALFVGIHVRQETMRSFDCIERPLSQLFRRYGIYVTKHPAPFLVVPVLFTLIMSMGVLYLDSIIDPIYLFTPSNAPSKMERQAVHDLWPLFNGTYMPGRSVTQSREVQITVLAKNDGNILQKPYSTAVNSLDWYIQNKVVVEYENQTYSYRDLCLSARNKVCPGNKHTQLLSDFYQHGFNITYPTVRIGSVSGYLGSSLGGVKVAYGKNDTIILASARAWLMVYHLQFYPSNMSLISGRWEKAFEMAMKNYTHDKQYIDITFFHSQTLAEELKRNADSLIPRFVIAFTILVVFSVSCNMSFIDGTFFIDWVLSKPILAILGVINAGMGIAAAIGMLNLIGTPYNDVVGVMPFLVVAVGVDNMFLMVAAVRRTNRAHRPADRIGECMSDAAISMFITSLTDAFSFGVGTITTIPAVQIFCIYTALAIVLTFIFQITFFVACLALATRWEAADLHCITLKKTITPNKMDNCNIFQKFFCLGSTTDPNPNNLKANICESGAALFFQDWFAPVLMQPVIRGLAIVWFIIYMFFAVYGCMQLREGLEPVNLLVDDSYAIPHYRTLEEYFWHYGPSVQIVVNNAPDFRDPRERLRIKAMAHSFASTKHTIGDESIQFWLLEMERYYEKEVGLNITDAAFYGLARHYFAAKSTEMWPDDVRWSKLPDGSPYIKSFRFLVGMRDISTSVEQQDATLTLREVASRYPGYNVTTFMPLWLFTDQYAIVVPNTVQNIAIAIAVMIVIALLLIPQPMCALWVALAIASIDVGVIGFMTLWNVRLDAISMITIIMSIGFSVDYSAHVTYGYVTSSHPEPRERIREALAALGWPLVQGAVSTILAVVVLADIPAYMIITFFKTVFLAIVLGLLHGLVFLPVTLSLFVRGSRNVAVVPAVEHAQVEDLRTWTSKTSTKE